MYDSASPSRMERPVAVGTGLVALDVITDRAGGFDPIVRSGGSCANVMSNLAWLGWATMPWARLKRDEPGDFVRTDLQEMGVDIRFVLQSDDGSTPIILQINRDSFTPKARHSFNWRCPECGHYFPVFKAPLTKDAEIITSQVVSPRIFYFDRAFPAALNLAEYYSRQGVPVFFEPNSIRDEKTFERACAASTILKYSAERLGSSAALVDDARVPIQIETLGAEGLRYRLKSNQWFSLPVVEAPSLADAAGSGDWCTAGLIDVAFRESHGRLGNSVVRKGLQLGQALAALNCAYLGARGLAYAMAGPTGVRAATELLRHRKNAQTVPPRLAGALAKQMICPECRWAQEPVVR